MSVGHTGAMELVAEMEATRPPGAVFGWIEDLGFYPRWLEIVTRATPRVDPGETRPTWDVDLRGRLGPVARSKRLRMVRTVHDPGQRVVFERHELDGRSHSPWRLEAEVTPAGSAGAEAHLRVVLRYEGRFFGPVLERMLGDEIVSAKSRLADLLESDAVPEVG